MIVLGIESTCDETAAALVEDGRHLLSNVISTSVKEQALYGGVVPEIASRRHCEFISATVKKALLDAGKTIDDVDAVAVTFAPGLIGAVLVGVNFAKGLAYSAGKPLVPVHHLRGHIAALYLTHPELKPPFLCLVASGGHSHIVEVQDYTHYHILGHTVDDAAGEAFDKVARTLGLPYPGGPSVANAAKTGNPKAYRLPVPHVEGKYNVSFSGLKTAVLDAAHRLPPGGVALYYLKPGQTDYTEAQKVYAKVTAPGVYTFDLGGQWVTGLRIDPDSVGGVPTLFTGIDLNPPRPWYTRFVPTAGWWLVLAFVPAVAAAMASAVCSFFIKKEPKKF